MAVRALCRECGDEAAAATGRCGRCGSPRMLYHPELGTLSIAHLDCDAFYASVEKRDRPDLVDRPVIVGGRQRGVVLACCYIARSFGVRSAMAMFKALDACPDAVVIRPDMAKYAAVGRQVRAAMLATTPLVEPLSIDEAFLDLAGTEAVHGGCPARTLARLARRIEREIGITVSIGLSYNKFLAKIASDLDKPRGFKVIGRAEARAFLAPQPVSLLFGVGAALQRRLAGDGITRIGDLQAADEGTLVRRYGTLGRRLYRFARGDDARPVTPDRPTKSVSAETTFERDLALADDLEPILWTMAEAVARRLKASSHGAGAVVLKLKTAEFRIITRRATLPHPTQLADRLWRAALPLLRAEATGPKFRLLGLGAEALVDGRDADPPDLLDQAGAHWGRIEQTVDQLRDKLGRDAIALGRGLTRPR